MHSVHQRRLNCVLASPAELDALRLATPASLCALCVFPSVHTAHTHRPTCTHKPTLFAMRSWPHPALLQVENDDVALRLTAELNRGKCGRVSFMPLNRMNPPEVTYPDQVRAGHAALSCAVPACCALLCACCAGLLLLLLRSSGRAARPLPAALLLLAPARMPTWPAPCLPLLPSRPACPPLPCLLLLLLLLLLPCLPRSTAATWCPCSRSSSMTQSSSQPSDRWAGRVGGWAGCVIAMATVGGGAGGGGYIPVRCRGMVGLGWVLLAAPYQLPYALRIPCPRSSPRAGVWQDAGVPQPGHRGACVQGYRPQLRDHGGRPGGEAGNLPRRLLRRLPLQDPGHEGDQGGWGGGAIACV